MLKILHTADWHLGQSFHGFSRDTEHAAFLDWLLQQLQQHRPHAMLAAHALHLQRNNRQLHHQQTGNHNYCQLQSGKDLWSSGSGIYLHHHLRITCWIGRHHAIHDPVRF